MTRNPPPDKCIHNYEQSQQRPERGTQPIDQANRREQQVQADDAGQQGGRAGDRVTPGTHVYLVVWRIRPRLRAGIVVPEQQHDAHLDNKQNGIKMQEVDAEQVVERELKQTIRNDMRNDNDLRAQRWHSPGEQAHHHYRDNRNIVETGEYTNDLP